MFHDPDNRLTCTTVIECDIRTTDDLPVYQKSYPYPVAYEEEIDNQIRQSDEIAQPTAIQETPNHPNADKWLSPEVAVSTERIKRLPDLGASTDDIITESSELLDQPNRTMSPANMPVKSVGSQSVKVIETADIPINVSDETLSRQVNVIRRLDEVLILACPSIHRLDPCEQIVMSPPSKFEGQVRDSCPVPVTLEYQPVTWDPGVRDDEIEWLKEKTTTNERPTTKGQDDSTRST